MQPGTRAARGRPTEAGPRGPLLRLGTSVPTYLLEAYMPRAQTQDACAAGQRAQAAVDELARQGVPIRYIRTTFLPDDETCFHAFEASSAEQVEQAGRRAGLGHTRVIAALETSQPTRRCSIKKGR